MGLQGVYFSLQKLKAPAGYEGPFGEQVHADVVKKFTAAGIPVLTEEQMEQLGVYISDPLSPDETDRRFSEPAIFCVRPDGVIQIVCLSNGPAARPDLDELLDGMKFNIEHKRPARGTV